MVSIGYKYDASQSQPGSSEAPTKNNKDAVALRIS